MIMISILVLAIAVYEGAKLIAKAIDPDSVD